MFHYFSKIRVALTNNNLLFCKAGNEINIKECITGDFIVENENVTLVLSAQEKYLSNDNISELLGGRFKVLGKIIKICHDENEKIDLLRKTSLGILDSESKKNFYQLSIVRSW